MKRSEINAIMRSANEFMRQHGFYPPIRIAGTLSDRIKRMMLINSSLVASGLCYQWSDNATIG